MSFWCISVPFVILRCPQMPVLQACRLCNLPYSPGIQNSVNLMNLSVTQDQVADSSFHLCRRCGDANKDAKDHTACINC